MQTKFFKFYLYLFGLDLGEVKDVVDQGQQVVAGHFEIPNIVHLLFRQIRHLQQLGHADHAVHWGTDFVAHVGQELALGMVGGFGLVLGLLQFLLRPFPFTDVPPSPGETDDITATILQR